MSKELSSTIPNSLNEHWMPFSANKEFKENPRLIVGAQGVYLKDHLGRSQIIARVKVLQIENRQHGQVLLRENRKPVQIQQKENRMPVLILPRENPQQMLILQKNAL